MVYGLLFGIGVVEVDVFEYKVLGDWLWDGDGIGV